MVSRSDPTQIVAISTPLGWLAIAWNPSGVEVLKLGLASWQQAVAAIQEVVRPELPLDAAPPEVIEEAEAPRALRALLDRLQAYCQGTATSLAEFPVVLPPGLTSFQRDVIDACRAIPCGQTSTYGELARAAGYPGAARAVGNVMRTNRIALLIPCHRVVGVNGLGGYSSPRGLATKQELLALERGDAVAQAPRQA